MLKFKMVDKAEMKTEMREKSSSNMANKEPNKRHTSIGMETAIDQESGGEDPEGLQAIKPNRAAVKTKKQKKGMEKYKYHTVFRGKVQRSTYTRETFDMFNKSTDLTNGAASRTPNTPEADGNNNQDNCAIIRDVKQLNDHIKTGELTKVTQMTFSDEDKKLTKLPPKLSTCTNLTHLTVTLSKIESLPPFLSELKLTNIDFRENQISNIDGLMKSKTVKFLDLTRNQLIALPGTIGKLSSIQALIVNGNRIRALPKEITQLKTLTELQCSSNMLKNLPDNIGNLESLKSLDVSSNPIGLLPDSLCNIGNLTDLRANGCRIKAVPSSIDSMFELKHLFLSNNELGLVPPVLQKLPNLETLAIKKNAIKEMSTTMSKLKSLNLDDNDISAISDALLSCKNLETLSIQRNRLTGVPNKIGRLSKLRSLQLGYNPIEQMPNEVSELENLRVLSLRMTRIQILPPSVGKMNQLNSIDLHFTKLSDPVKKIYEQGVGAFKRYISGLKPGSGSKPVGSGPKPVGSGQKPVVSQKPTEKPMVSLKPVQKQLSVQSTTSADSGSGSRPGSEGGSRPGSAGGKKPASAKSSVSSENDKL